MITFIKNIFNWNKKDNDDLRCACNRNKWACTYPICKNGEK
jgi:hypothetical protein